VVESLQAGAHGYLHRRVSPRRLLEGIRAVARHETVVDSAVAEYLMPYLDLAGTASTASTATHPAGDQGLTLPPAPDPVAPSPVLPGNPRAGEGLPVSERGACGEARGLPYPSNGFRAAWFHLREDLEGDGTGDSTGDGTEQPAEPAATRAATPPGSFETLLTRRQRIVASLVADGLSNSEIASRLYLSPATVKSHLTIILRRLGLRDRTQLAILVTRQRELATPESL
jgi:DNA-binding NarL/FixJ family response regulator